MDSATRYGFYVPEKGYIYDGAHWENQKFCDDQTKACFGKSFVGVLTAIEYAERIKEKFPDVEIVTFQMAAVVTAKQPVSVVREQAASGLKNEYSHEVAEYNRLKIMYDAMDNRAIEDVPRYKWNHFKNLEWKLRELELI